MTSTDPDLLARLQDSVGGLGTLTERLGIELLTASPEHVSARMPVEGNTQVVGLLHGGASAALAETVASVAATLHAGRGRGAVGVDLNATHHRAVSTGWVTAVATPLHLGGRLATYEVAVTDEDGRRVCTARLTCMLVDRP
jgi:1,4-dihydroxy-2-naphthoyl-CoA hydrolase